MEKEEFEGVRLLVVHRGKVTDRASPAPPRGMSPSPAPPPPAPASFLSQASVRVECDREVLEARANISR